MIRQLNYSRVWLLLILIFALFLRLNAAFSYPNILWPDEIFQTLEQGHRLAFGNGMIPWDFRDGIRSWLFPGILGGIMKLTAGFSEGASGYLASIKIFLSLLSLIPVWIGFSIAYESIGLAGAILTGGICAIWFEFIYFAP
ncbi:MAG: mannosyltransferase, partial [bacterium]